MRSWLFILLLLWGCSPAPDHDVGADGPDGGDRAADGGGPEVDGGALDGGEITGTTYGTPTLLGTLTGIPETSGIVASRAHPGVFWVHNDSGNPAEIYAIDGSANVLATITLSAATNRDWEDITLMPDAGGDFLYVGDHGDNLARTSSGTMSSRGGSIQLYRLREPNPMAGDAAMTPELLTLAYPDGPHDCESLFADPATGDVWLIAKVDVGLADVYVARAPLDVGATIALERVASFDFLSATAADLSADGMRLAVRNYGRIRVFPVTTTIADAFAADPIRPTRQGSAAEAIAFAAGSYDLLTIAEGDPADLLQIPWE